MNTIKQKTFIGSLWNFISNTAARIIDFAVYIVLARLLSLDDFGLVVYCMLLIEFARAFTNVGISQNLIQRKQWCIQYASSTFVFSVFLSFIVALFCCLVGGAIAYHYHSVVAAKLIVVLSILPLMSGIGSTFLAKMQREFKNKQITYITTSTAIISGIFTIVLAFLDFGVWSLVLGKVSQELLTLIFLMLGSHFRPKLTFNFDHAREIVSFGLPILGISVLIFLRERASNLLTGAALGASSLALMAVANKGVYTLSQSTLTPINAMVVPAFSRLAKERVVPAFYKLIGMLSLAILPLFIGLGAVAETFLLLTFGDKFASAGILIQLLVASAPVLIVGWFFPSLLISAAATKAALHINIINSFGTLIVASATIWYGIVPMLIGLLVWAYVSFPIRLWIVQKYIDVKFTNILYSTLPSIVGSTLMFVFVWSITDWLSSFTESLALQLFALVIMGMAIYITLLFLFFRKTTISSIEELKLLIKDRKIN